MTKEKLMKEFKIYQMIILGSVAIVMLTLFFSNEKEKIQTAITDDCGIADLNKEIVVETSIVNSWSSYSAQLLGKPKGYPRYIAKFSYSNSHISSKTLRRAILLVAGFGMTKEEAINEMYKKLPEAIDEAIESCKSESQITVNLGEILSKEAERRQKQLKN